MTKSAVELTNGHGIQNNTFSIGKVFLTSFSVFGNNVLMFISYAMIFSVALYFVNIIWIAVAGAPWKYFSSITTYRNFDFALNVLIGITYMFLYPIAALFITRDTLMYFQGTEPSVKLELRAFHFFLACVVGVMFLALFGFIRYIAMGHVFTDLIGRAVAVVMFSLFFVELIPVSVAEYGRCNGIVRRSINIISKNHINVIVIILSSAAMLFVIITAIEFFTGLLIPVPLPRSSGPGKFIVITLRYVLDSSLYAYLFMLPAVIYHHLRLEELSRESE